MAILTSQEQKWVDTRLAQIQSDQTTFATQYAKYQEQARTLYGNIYVQVDELVAPGLEIGYRVLLMKLVNNVMYYCSYGFARDAAINTWDWKVMPVTL